MDDKFILNNLPMPPTANRLYLPINGRFIPSPELKMFKKKMELYGLQNKAHLREIASHCLCAISNGYGLHFDRKFIFPRSKIFSKKNEPKKYDVTNRIKAIDDGISLLIGVDDKFIFESRSRKIIQTSSLYERLEVTIGFVYIADFCIAT